MKDLLQQLFRGTPLTAQQAESAFTDIMDGTADPVQTAALLTLLATREPTVDELAGAALVMRRHVVAIDAPENVIDTCGTGGVHSNLFNVSTTAALVAAAAGAPVAKHGNRAVTSKSGSSDVLKVLGVNIDTTPAQAARCLRQANICFAFAQKHHPAMRHVSPIRQALGFATLFNLVGPLTNPAGARRQLVGTRSPELGQKLLQVLIRLGADRVLVVTGQDPVEGPLCEIAIGGPTEIAQYDGLATTRYSFRPEDIGFTRSPSAELLINSPEQSARKIQAVLAGEPGPARDIVLLNAAAALWTSGLTETLQEGVTKAAQALDTGAAKQTLAKLVELSHEPA